MGKPQKGSMTGKEARRIAEKAHRKEAFRQAKKGRGAPPPYSEQRTGLLGFLRGRG